jgi:hypothetical protein
MSSERQMFEASFGRPKNFFKLSAERQWEIDKDLGILDWVGEGLSADDKQRFKDHYDIKPKKAKKLKPKFKEYEVIYVNFEHLSFSWANGLYIVLDKKKDGILEMCSLGKDGKPALFSDGRFMTSCTGVKNKGIIKTNLTYKHYE